MSDTWRPAWMRGNFAMACGESKGGRGAKYWSDCMCPKHVLLTLHRDCPRDALSSITFLVARVTTTSWKPDSTCPPVKYSICLPA